jgi:hypothetical protein
VKNEMIHPELGEKTTAQITYRVSHCGGYYATTSLFISGRGITMTSDGKDHAQGKRTYRVTEKALAVLKAKYSVCYIAYL